MTAKKVFTTAPEDHPDVLSSDGQLVTSTPGYKGCQVVVDPEGSATITFKVDAPTMRRIQLRAQRMALDMYMWDQIIFRAVQDHVW